MAGVAAKSRAAVKNNLKGSKDAQNLEGNGIYHFRSWRFLESFESLG